MHFSSLVNFHTAPHITKYDTLKSVIYDTYLPLQMLIQKSLGASQNTKIRKIVSTRREPDILTLYSPCVASPARKLTREAQGSADHEEAHPCFPNFVQAPLERIDAGSTNCPATCTTEYKVPHGWVRGSVERRSRDTHQTKFGYKTTECLDRGFRRVRSGLTLQPSLLTLNSSKTEFLLIGLKKQLDKIHNSSLNTTHSARNLGFIFDAHLTFFNQISAVS